MDFKYIDSKKAKLYSNVSDYPAVCTAALVEAYRQQSECVIKDGIMQKGLIVRHLLMPQATCDAMLIFDWVRQNTPNAFFSIMSQYVPISKALDMPVINRKITQREYDKVTDYILSSGFENCYIQERSSADKDYIPDFNFVGL